MKIAVGSTNPVKINAIINAASETWPEVLVKGFKTQSGVSEQPMSEEETRIGAKNRAKSAFEQMPRAELGIGLEGGVFEMKKGELWSTVWICVYDGQNFYEANGARFSVPEIVAKQILKGGEMGPIIASMVGEDDIRSKQGMIGVITKNFVDRTEEYSGIAKMALGLWYGRAWQNKL